MILKSTNYGRSEKDIENRKGFEDELGDVLFSLVTLANSLEIDLENTLKSAMNKYEKILEIVLPGSEKERKDFL
ncbi:MAG: MazG nucleotide pyrophosphohydrolase domain-containing protein [Candidatus Aenigmatarchaeota archaeon]